MGNEEQNVDKPKDGNAVPPKSPNPSEEKTPISEHGDSRTSWIYLMKKGDLVIELTKFGLLATGSVEEMRKRLVKFIREGKATPQLKTDPFAFPPSTATSVSLSSNNLTVPAITLTTTSSEPTATTTPSIVQTGITGSTVSALHTAPSDSPARITDPLSKMYKWNVSFNGQGDPVTFLEQLTEIYTSQGVSPDRLMPRLPEFSQ